MHFWKQFPAGRLPLHSPTAGRVIKHPEVPAQHPVWSALGISPEEEVAQSPWPCPKNCSPWRSCWVGWLPCLPPELPRGDPAPALGGPASPSPAAPTSALTGAWRLQQLQSGPKCNSSCFGMLSMTLALQGRHAANGKQTTGRRLLTRKIISFTGCCPYK